MIFVNGADLRRDRVIFVEVGAMESLRTTYDSDDEAQSYKKPGVRLEDVGNDADDEGVDDEPAATLSERALSPSMSEPLPEPLPASVAAVATHQESPPTPPVAELADGPQCLPAVPPRAHEVLCSSERADEAVCLPARRQREPTLFLEVDSEEASEPAESDNSDSDFDHGSCVHELRSGRYSKLEGCFYGADTIGDLTLHSQFVAAANASSGYKSLARGMWVDCSGVPWEETQLVRIISGSVAESAKGKPQKKYVVLLYAGDQQQDRWYYAPMQLVKPLDDCVLFGEGGLFNGQNRWVRNDYRHSADKALQKWTPQPIGTLARKAGELTPRKSCCSKRPLE